MAACLCFNGRKQRLFVCSRPAKGCAFLRQKVSHGWVVRLRYRFKNGGLSLTLRSTWKHLRTRWALMQHCTSLCGSHNLTIICGLSVSNMTLPNWCFHGYFGLNLIVKSWRRATALFAIFHDELLVPVFSFFGSYFEFAENLPNLSL